MAGTDNVGGATGTIEMEEVDEPQPEDVDLDGNLSPRFARPDGSAEKKVEKAEKPTWFADVQQTIADMDKMIAAQKDEIVTLKIENVTVKIDLEKYRHADAEYRESHRRDAKENADLLAKQKALLAKLKGEHTAHQQGYRAGRKKPTITNSKLEGAKEHLEEALEKLTKMKLERDELRSAIDTMFNEAVLQPMHAGAWFQLKPKHAPNTCVEVGGGDVNDGGARVNIWTASTSGQHWLAQLIPL